MQTKFGLMTLGAIAGLMLFGGSTAEAKEQSTEKPDEKVMVKIVAGDTLSAIADKHETSYVRLFNANDTINDPNMINAGDEIRVPGEDEKLPNRLAELSVPEQTAVVSAAASSQPVAQPAVSGSMARGSSAGNGYAPGYCTWYAKEMRPDLPNNLGNGGSWVASARAQGIETGSTPRVGAIAEQPGHVAYVEAVNGSTVTISEMNYGGGLGQVHRRTVPASQFQYIY